MDKIFEYDHTINEENFCNFDKEKEILKKHIDSGDCVKILGPRNFGKTSLIRNIVAPKWEVENPSLRTVIYADLYSVESLENISQEITTAFNHAISSKKTFMEKGMSWIKALKNIRPVWQPSNTGDGLGEFSIRTEQNSGIVDFEIIFENIRSLHINNKMEFLVIMDEFQEISRIKRAEAKLRGALQTLPKTIPVVLLGSKQHLLGEIFDKPKAPFYSWGYTLEIGYIPYKQYEKYINERFSPTGKHISETSSTYLQDKVNRIPEAINRLCDFISRDSRVKNIDDGVIDGKMKEFIDKSRSIYEENFAGCRTNEKNVLSALAKLKKTSSPTGKQLLRELPDVSKTGVSDIIKRLLDDSVISRNVDHNGDFYYMITDPFFSEFLKIYKIV